MSTRPKYTRVARAAAVRRIRELTSQNLNYDQIAEAMAGEGFKNPDKTAIIARTIARLTCKYIKRMPTHAKDPQLPLVEPNRGGEDLAVFDLILGSTLPYERIVKTLRGLRGINA